MFRKWYNADLHVFLTCGYSKSSESDRVELVEDSFWTSDMVHKMDREFGIQWYPSRTHIQVSQRTEKWFERSLTPFDIIHCYSFVHIWTWRTEFTYCTNLWGGGGYRVIGGGIHGHHPRYYAENIGKIRKIKSICMENTEKYVKTRKNTENPYDQYGKTWKNTEFSVIFLNSRYFP